MPDLPERADIDQLRRQARELLRAAVAGEPEALTRLRAVSERPTLAAAQLAVAREHGFRSWPALRSEAESRRQSADRHLRADAARPEAQDITLGRWSFGGAGTIEVEEGELTLGILIAGPEGASLEASLEVAEAAARMRQYQRWFPELRDVTVTDDQGSASTLGPPSGYADRQPGPGQRLRYEVACTLDPVPEGGSRWLDVQGRDSSVTRLLRSALVPVRVGGLSAVAGSPAEQELRDMAWWILLGYLDKAMREGPDLKRRCRDVLAQTARLREGGPADGAAPCRVSSPACAQHLSGSARPAAFPAAGTACSTPLTALTGHDCTSISTLHCRRLTARRYASIPSRHGPARGTCTFRPRPAGGPTAQMASASETP